jgi:hypothetical protein
MQELDEEGFFEGEKPLIGRVMLELVQGKSDALIEFMCRQEPISPSAAYFVGVFLKEGFGEFAFRLERTVRRGRPGTDSRHRVNYAAIWVNWTVNKPNPGCHNPKREDAIQHAAQRFHVDSKAVRASLEFFEKWDKRPLRPREFRRLFKQLLVNTIADIVVDLSG